MNKWKLQCSVVIFSILCHLAIAAWGGQSPHVMTTEVPEGVAVRDRIETMIGDLRLQDDVPERKTAELVYENLDFQRGLSK